MAESGGSERAVAGSGLLRSLDYPCTRRLRLRRLFACIRGHGDVDVYLTARKKMNAIFNVKYLVKLVREGQWKDAFFYLSSFPKWNYEARLLDVFMFDLLAFKAFADGQVKMIGYLSDWLMGIYKKPVLDKYPCFATVVADVLFMRREHASAFLDWQFVRRKAAKMVEEIANKTPELRDRMHCPRSSNSLYHFMPIGSKRNMKNATRKQLADVVQFYLQVKKRLASLSPEAYSDLPTQRGEHLIALFDTCFQAGRLLGPEHGQLPEVSSEEEFPYMQHKLARGFSLTSIKRAKLPSKPDTSQRPAVVGSSVTNSGTKRSRCFQESNLDTVHPLNVSKRPAVVGSSVTNSEGVVAAEVLTSSGKMDVILDKMFLLLKTNGGLQWYRHCRDHVLEISAICNKQMADHVSAMEVIAVIHNLRKSVAEMNQDLFHIIQLRALIQNMLDEVSSLEGLCLNAVEAAGP